MNLVSKLKLYYPELYRGHRNGLTVPELAVRIQENEHFSSYKFRSVKNSIENYLKNHPDYEDEYELNVKRNVANKAEKNIGEYNDREGKLSFSGSLYDRAIELKEHYGSQYGANLLIADELDKEFFGGIGRINKISVEKFFTREKRKGNLDWEKGKSVAKEKPKRVLTNWDKEYKTAKHGFLSLGYIAMIYARSPMFFHSDGRPNTEKMARLFNRNYGLNLNSDSVSKGIRRYRERIEEGKVLPLGEVVNLELINRKCKRGFSLEKELKLVA